ncbi:serine carboxypeptidase-like 51 [Zostera marina]|uniref:Carboxypeptidase n=1 Tax=Zostera marina TaxID=29655 RepID=A0A0K9PJB9_ZOSMR|nr:serine carboxypeptidase-like 51 [Zostera marina]
MFWWLYRSPHRSPSWPMVLWLQGGPGSSGVGIGNFQEIGPLDTDLNTRSSTWLQKADLLFVDNPVGTGYSFVEDNDLLVRTDHQAAADLTTLLKKIFMTGSGKEGGNATTLFLVAESYGGKFAVTLGLSVFDAIKNGDLNLQLGGVVLGDSWISPEDFGPILADVSRMDKNGLRKSNSMAKKIQRLIKDGNYSQATNAWVLLESIVEEYSNNVDFYNFLLDSNMDPLAASISTSGELKLAKASVLMRQYSQYLSKKSSSFDSDSNSSNNLSDFMNGVIRKKLKIIPNNVSWGGQDNLVFNAMATDFMKPRINEVDELLSRGVDVTVYNGQIDLICATKGTEAWIQKLKWVGLRNFTNQVRTPLYCGGGGTKGFYKSFKNMHFYWILGAGHFVPVDQPCLALNMLSEITKSPITLHSSTNFDRAS